MLCHVRSVHVMLGQVRLGQVRLGQVTSCPVLSCHAMLYCMLSYYVASYYIMICGIMFINFLGNLVLKNMTFFFFPDIFCYFFDCHFIINEHENKETQMKNENKMNMNIK